MRPAVLTTVAVLAGVCVLAAMLGPWVAVLSLLWFGTLVVMNGGQW